MEDMQRSTFRTSLIDRSRRRTAGPALSLVAGTTGSVTISRDVPAWHPASEDFTPDGPPAATRLRPVRDSEPGTPALRSTSRGNASPDSVGTASPGSGPISDRLQLIDRVARFLEDTAGVASAHGPDTRIRIRQIR
jgi:hypothetical protein